MSYRIPFQEKNTPWRGPLDLLTGRYPLFLFGGTTDALLPVFHFHNVTPDQLEPCLAFLKDNNYRTVTSRAISEFARDGAHPGPQSVALTFDDGWLSLWSVAYPLLRRYNFKAIAYISPGRTPDADRARPTMESPGWAVKPGDEELFASWPELKAMCESGIIDVQAHTLTHSVVFCDPAVTGFVHPGYRPPVHLRPILNELPSPRHVTPEDLGCPLYAQRSRMSDAFRYLEPAEVRQRCMELVRRQGGKDFFDRREWRALLTVAAEGVTGRFETAIERNEAILDELVSARRVLSSRLPGHDVRHMCFPFSICGRVAESLLEEAGYETAFADRLLGFRAVKAHTNPYRLMRLKHQFLFCLPGNRRQTFYAAWSAARKTRGSV